MNRFPPSLTERIRPERIRSYRVARPMPSTWAASPLSLRPAEPSGDLVGLVLKVADVGAERIEGDEAHAAVLDRTDPAGPHQVIQGGAANAEHLRGFLRPVKQLVHAISPSP